MNMLRITMIVFALLLATGCSDKKTPESPEQKPAGVIPQAQLKALDKAKGVENTLMQDAQRQRDQIDQQSQ